MNPSLFDWGAGHKTQLVGALAILTGIITIVTSGGDSAQMNAGWTQIMGGAYAIFMHAGVKKVEDKVEKKGEEVKATVSGTGPQGFLAASTGVVEVTMGSGDIERLKDRGEILLMAGMTEVKIKKAN
jgi:hypothetical protein